MRGLQTKKKIENVQEKWPCELRVMQNTKIECIQALFPLTTGTSHLKNIYVKNKSRQHKAACFCVCALLKCAACTSQHWPSTAAGTVCILDVEEVNVLLIDVCTRVCSVILLHSLLNVNFLF